MRFGRLKMPVIFGLLPALLVPSIAAAKRGRRAAAGPREDSLARRVLSVGVAILLAVASGAAMAAPASAAAVVTSQTSTTTLSDKGLTDPCLPNATGTLAGTAVVTDLIVETATTFHVTETEVDSGRIDWSNGDYTIIGSTDRVTFDAAFNAAETHIHSDFGDVFSADGVLLFRETFQFVKHYTIANGVFAVQFDFGHAHVFGSGCTPG